mmetsp:Transcript_15509/g.13259  ORF Transcript_15509/g.13259 Transcript_15509/m.13259 type:complete len:163 (+) Transcript_15509:654-1142(+)
MKDFRKEYFKKKVDELLLDKLEYDSTLKTVLFKPDGVKHQVPKTFSVAAKVKTAIAAKIYRMRHKTGDFGIDDKLLIRTSTQRIDRSYIQSLFYWDRIQHKLHIYLSKLDSFVPGPKIIVKFDQLGPNSTLRQCVFDGNLSNEALKKSFRKFLNVLEEAIEI